MSRTRETIDKHAVGLDERSLLAVERLVDVVFDVLPDADAERKWGRLTSCERREAFAPQREM